MGLLTRLVAPLPGEAKLPVHQFMAALSEFKRGAPNVTLQSIVTGFGLSAGEATELQTFLSNLLLGLIDAQQLHEVLLMGEMGLYTVSDCSSRLVTVTNTLDLLPLVYQQQIEILSRAYSDYVVVGCAPTKSGTDMNISIAKGAVMTNGTLRPVTSGAVLITPADSTLPRIDMIVVDSSGTKAVRTGTPSPKPIPAALTGNDVALVAVFIPPGVTVLTATYSKDVRVVRTASPLIVGKTTTATSFNNSNAVQTLSTFTVPSGVFSAGRSMRVRGGGSILINGALATTVAIGIQFGGTTMFADTSASVVLGSVRLAWTIDVDIMARSFTSQVAKGSILLGPAGILRVAATNGIGDLASAGFAVPLIGTSAVDADSADRAIAIIAQIGLANASNEIVLEGATIELI